MLHWGLKKNVFCKTQFCVLLPHKNETTMKLAEALSIRKDLQKRIQQIGMRIQNNVKVQEGDKPLEKPVTVVDVRAIGKLVDDCSARLRQLDMEIQALNFQTELI